jgi:glycosyltransferase involved in cell wall biosynthesis
MKPLRVLQVVGTMHRGGIETWLMSVLSRVDRSRIAIDFLVSNSSPSPFAEEIAARGSQIIVCPAHSEPLRYMRNLSRALAQHGPYDVVHSHLHHLNGVVTMVAARRGVPARIAHSHFDISGKNAAESGFDGVRYRAARLMMGRFATHTLAASHIAGKALFGEVWDRRGQVLLCGIDLERFRAPHDRNSVRNELGLPADAIVIGHAGRFVPQKNHGFILEIAEVMAKRDPRFHFLLLGDGPLRAEMTQRAESAGISKQVHFPGARPDVPRLMKGAMDAYLFPSHFEGAPLALVEAQAAGLPCIYSDVCAVETDLVPALLRRTPLSKSAQQWAETITDLLNTCPASARKQAFALVEGTPFNVARSIDDLENLYFSAAGTRAHAAAS